MRLWVVILVPTLAFAFTFLTASPTTEDLHKCDNAAVILLFTSADGQDGRDGAPSGDDCRAAARRQVGFVGAIAAAGGGASFVAFKRRRPRGGAAEPGAPAAD